MDSNYPLFNNDYYIWSNELDKIEDDDYLDGIGSTRYYANVISRLLKYNGFMHRKQYSYKPFIRKLGKYYILAHLKDGMTVCFFRQKKLGEDEPFDMHIDISFEVDDIDSEEEQLEVCNVASGYLHMCRRMDFNPTKKKRFNHDIMIRGE